MDGSQDSTEPVSAGSVEADWMVDHLSRSTDIVLAIDADTTVTWCNRAIFTILGHLPADVLGRSFAEFVHPEDLDRAAEVMALATAGAFDETPITPALYRVLSAAGDWVNLEVNASPSADGSMLVVGRLGGDLVLTDRLLEAVSAGEPVEQQVELVMELARWRHPREGYVIVYRGEDGEELALTANVPFAVGGPQAPSGPRPWDAAIRAGHELVVTDLAALGPGSEVIGADLAAAAVAAGFDGCLAVPVSDPAHPEGACIVIWTTADGPTASGNRYAMSNMQRAFTLVLQERALVRGLERAARVDEVTGLTSRPRFLELLAELGAQADADARHAVLYLDLDGFKEVNDRYGHAAGDLVLRATAERIVEVLSSGALVSRLGGDEFAVLCPPGTTKDMAIEVATSIIEAVGAPTEVGDATAEVGASIGVAVGGPGDAPTTVLNAADVALLEAKAGGRRRWRVAGSS